ncbi:MAG: pseudouridine synthase [Candidatus Omnitrophota bacterium]
MRLNNFLSRAGCCARRKAVLYIKDGKVKVNGAVVREPWYVVKDGDSVYMSGRKLSVEKELYLIVNKPKGVTATLEDRFAAHKITDLIPKEYGRLYPVGRLDKDSRGLIVLTNDGDFCYKLTHPKFEIEKEYLVMVEGEPDARAISRLLKGVRDEDELLKVSSCSVIWAKNGKAELKVIVAEGKKRHIRRLFKFVGFPVMDIKRIRIGGIRLGELGEGRFRKLTKDDAYRLAVHSS